MDDTCTLTPATPTARDRLQSGLDALTDAEAEHLLAGLRTTRGMAEEAITFCGMPAETRAQLAALVKMLEVGK